LAVGSALHVQPAHFEKDVTEFLARHCVDCHSGKKPKANISHDITRSEADEAAVVLTGLSNVEMDEKRNPKRSPPSLPERFSGRRE
jgi:hypothetical protein